jgi:hypothetical protein
MNRIRIAYAARESTVSIEFNSISQFLVRQKTEVCSEKSGDILRPLSSVSRRNVHFWSHFSELVEKVTAICFWLDQYISCGQWSISGIYILGLLSRLAVVLLSNWGDSPLLDSSILPHSVTL